MRTIRESVRARQRSEWRQWGVEEPKKTIMRQVSEQQIEISGVTN